MPAMAKNNKNRFHAQMVALIPRMRRFAYALTSNREEADDLVQTACERALNRKHQWRPGTRLDSWMFRIIYTQRIDMTRSQRVRKAYIHLEDKMLRGNTTTTNNEVESRIMLRQVLRAMENLSEKDRAVLSLVCIEGLSYKDSASTIGVPVGTVMSRLARARRRLHEAVYGNNINTEK